MNVTLTESGYTLDGKWRLVPVEPTHEMAILSLNGGLDYKLGVKAAPPPPQQSQWQPIATAPKDKRVLLLRPTAPEWLMVMSGRHDSDGYAKNPKPYWNVDNWSIGKTVQRQHPPTHWMPLPEPAP